MTMINKNFNLHLTDLCNYTCKYCFIKKEKKTLSLDECKKIIDNIAEYFRVNHVTDGKVNLAGGEPTTCRYLHDLIDYMVSKGIKTTLITNGSLLNDKFISQNRNKLYMIGLSVDSLNADTNMLLGRSRGKKVIDYETLKHLCLAVKANGIRLKINTVVSKLNLNEDIVPLLKDVCPDRVKFLQMLPSEVGAKEFAITKEEFTQYLKKYQDFDIVAESSDEISNSYMIVDSSGFLANNNLHIDKQYSALEQPIGEIVQNIKFSFVNESKRYQS